MTDEALKVLAKFARKHPANPGRALVVGSKCYDDKPDRRAFYDDGFGVDLFEGEGVDLVHDMEQPLPDIGLFDHVDCVSVLEHVQRPWLMAANIEVVMKPGASILVCVPFVWRIHSYPGDYWRMTPEALKVLFPSVEWIDTKFIVGSKLRKRVPGMNLSAGKYLARAELVAAGIRCASTS